MELKKRPDNFKLYDVEIMSNFDRLIDYDVAKHIKGKKLFSVYSTWEFHSYVWWEGSMWHCEIWQHHRHTGTVSCKELHEIMRNVSDNYGYINPIQ